MIIMAVFFLIVGVVGLACVSLIARAVNGSPSERQHEAEVYASLTHDERMEYLAQQNNQATHGIGGLIILHTITDMELGHHEHADTSAE